METPTVAELSLQLIERINKDAEELIASNVSRFSYGDIVTVQWNRERCVAEIQHVADTWEVMNGAVNAVRAAQES